MREEPETLTGRIGTWAASARWKPPLLNSPSSPPLRCACPPERSRPSCRRAPAPRRARRLRTELAWLARSMITWPPAASAQPKNGIQVSSRLATKRNELGQRGHDRRRVEHALVVRHQDVARARDRVLEPGSVHAHAAGGEDPAHPVARDPDHRLAAAVEGREQERAAFPRTPYRGRSAGSGARSASLHPATERALRDARRPRVNPRQRRRALAFVTRARA